MSRIAGAITSMVLTRQLMLVIAGLGMVVLARLLEPADFGIFATVQATFLLLEIIVRFGLSEYLISAPRLSTGMLRSALGLSLTLACAVTALALVFLLTPLSGWLSADLHLGLLVMIPGLLVLPLILVPEAVLRRRLEFGVIAWLGVGTAAADVATGITLALLGAGPLALVAGMVASRLCSAAILVATSRRLLRGRLGGWRRFWPFAPHMTVTSLLPKSSDLGTVLIIPSALGVPALGLYNRAQTVVSLLDKVLLDGVGPVVLPAISNRLREGASVPEVYSAKTARLSVLTWPVFAVLALLAEPVTLLLLGDQWVSAIAIVRILCAVGIVVPFTSMSMQFFAATNQVDQYMRIQAVNQFVQVALCAAGAFHSLEAVAVGLVAARVFKAVHIRRHLRSLIGHHGAAERRGNYARAGAVSLAALFGPCLLVIAFPDGSPLLLSLGGIALAAIGWLAGVVLTLHPLRDDLRTLPILHRPALKPLRKMLR